MSKPEIYEWYSSNLKMFVRIVSTSVSESRYKIRVFFKDYTGNNPSYHRFMWDRINDVGYII